MSTTPVEVVDAVAHGDAVHHVEWRVGGIDGACAADEDATHCSGALAGGDVHTGCLALERFEGVAHRAAVELLLIDACEGARDIALALDAVSHDDHFVEQGVVLLEYYIDIVFPIQFDVLREITHITECQGGVGGGVERELSVQVGDGTDAGSILDDRHTDERLSRLIGHRSCHFLLLRTLRKHRLLYAEEHTQTDEKHPNLVFL